MAGWGTTATVKKKEAQNYNENIFEYNWTLFKNMVSQSQNQLFF